MEIQHCATPSSRPWFPCVVFLVTLWIFTFGTASAQNEDLIGFYWDEAYTENIAVTDSVPEILTGYLVLKNLSVPGGVVGWECCFEAEGPAIMVGSALEGMVINAGEPPCFTVGVGGPALPGGEAVLLATFQWMVTDDSAPITLTLTPRSFQPYPPTFMVYLPESDPDHPVPLSTTTGTPDVAWINHFIPVFSVNPGVMYFNGTPVGQSETKTVTVTNEGIIPIDLDVQILAECPWFSLSSPSGPQVLQPYQSAAIQITFTPTDDNVHHCSLYLGEVVPGINIHGLGDLLEYSWIAPSIVDFGTRVVGVEHNMRINIVNTSEEDVIRIDPELIDCGDRFWITSGGQPHDILPGNGRYIYISFAPDTVGSYACTLDLGEIIPPIPVVGQGRQATTGYTVTPSTLNFPQTVLGNYRDAYVTVRNTGDLDFTIDPYLEDVSPVFTITHGEGPTTVVPGQAVGVHVRFAPAEAGLVQTRLFLNNEFLPVTCAGLGLAEGPTTDFLGLYFDETALLTEIITVTPVELVNTYLILTGPSDLSGVAAWECTVVPTTGALFLEAQPRGQFINIGYGNELVIGLVEPLSPGSGSVVLAEVRFLVIQPMGPPVWLELHPTSNPFLPGFMSWISGDEPGVPIPLQTTSGTPQVALINPDIAVGNEMPTLRISQAPGEVRLQWDLPALQGDGYQVYRRQDGHAEVQLTQLTLTVSGSELTYVDRPLGMAAGTDLYYSYGVMQGEFEIARSAEALIKLESSVPAGTRLLANYPNPFNPQTEIPFELSKPGTVQLAIYDVTGRLVRTLVSESMDPGVYTRTWLGRDNGGRAVPSGAYYARLITDEKTDTQKMMLLR